jgi:predicted GIY-YIG superfamily endonuclease
MAYTYFVPGFTKKHGVKTLVYFETFEDVRVAIQRETRLKKSKRRWKIALIEKENPIGWYEALTAPQPWPDWLVAAERHRESLAR